MGGSPRQPELKQGALGCRPQLGNRGPPRAQRWLLARIQELPSCQRQNQNQPQQPGWAGPRPVSPSLLCAPLGSRAGLQAPVNCCGGQAAASLPTWAGVPDGLSGTPGRARRARQRAGAGWLTPARGPLGAGTSPGSEGWFASRDPPMRGAAPGARQGGRVSRQRRGKAARQGAVLPQPALRLRLARTRLHFPRLYRYLKNCVQITTLPSFSASARPAQWNRFSSHTYSFPAGAFRKNRLFPRLMFPSLSSWLQQSNQEE